MMMSSLVSTLLLIKINIHQFDVSADSSEDDIEIVIYDFDETLAASTLQLEIYALYPDLPFSDLMPGLNQMTDDQLLNLVFGGESRRDSLYKHFSKLYDNNIELAILSWGDADLIKESLTRMNLIKFFKPSNIIGGHWDDPRIDPDWDFTHIDEILDIITYSKAEKIDEMRQNCGHLTADQVIFIDDYKENIDEVRNSNSAITIFVSLGGGMTSQQMDKIEDLSDVE